MQEKMFVTPEYITAKEIKAVRGQLGLTQKSFAQLIGCSKPTVERWERREEAITGPICLLIKMLEKYPDYVEKMKIPEKTFPIRLYYPYLTSFPKRTAMEFACAVNPSALAKRMISS